MKRLSVAAFVLSLLFFVPFAPFIGLLLGIFALEKKKSKLAVASVVVGAVMNVVNMVLIALLLIVLTNSVLVNHLV